MTDVDTTLDEVVTLKTLKHNRVDELLAYSQNEPVDFGLKIRALLARQNLEAPDLGIALRDLNLIRMSSDISVYLNGDWEWTATLLRTTGDFLKTECGKLRDLMDDPGLSAEADKIGEQRAAAQAALMAKPSSCFTTPTYFLKDAMANLPRAPRKPGTDRPVKTAPDAPAAAEAPAAAKTKTATKRNAVKAAKPEPVRRQPKMASQTYPDTELGRAVAKAMHTPSGRKAFGQALRRVLNQRKIPRRNLAVYLGEKGSLVSKGMDPDKLCTSLSNRLSGLVQFSDQQIMDILDYIRIPADEFLLLVFPSRTV